MPKFGVPKTLKGDLPEVAVKSQEHPAREIIEKINNARENLLYEALKPLCFNSHDNMGCMSVQEERGQMSLFSLN